MLSRDTSKPTGAVAVMSAVRSTPVTVICVVPDAVPYVVVTPDSEPSVPIVGVAGASERVPKFTSAIVCPADTVTVCVPGGAGSAVPYTLIAHEPNVPVVPAVRSETVSVQVPFDDSPQSRTVENTQPE